MEHFADRLLAAIDQKGSPVCVGIDPVFDRLPDALRRGETIEDRAAAIERYCIAVLDAVAAFVPAVKPQSAYFEVFGSAGVAVYERVIQHAHKLGLLVIGDVKRNDIGSTAAAYAAGHLEAPDSADAVTVNGYLGSDGLDPFIQAGAKTGRGVFCLVRTSNPSAAAVQDFADASGKKLYEHVAQMVAQLGSQAGLVGKSGYSCLGAVVGATWPAEAKVLRAMMPQQIFLVPGYGAQGATADDCMASFNADGRGAIVNASRSVIFAYREKQYAGMDWKQAVSAAAKAFAADLAAAVARRM